MVGNDVVDFRDPDAAACAVHPGFDARVFAPDERSELAASADPARHRWRLWAAKEAAYKLARKRSRSAVFSPRRFRVRLEDSTVDFDESSFRIELEEDAGAVHVVARLDGAERAMLLKGFRRLSQAEVERDPHLLGRAARQLSLERIAPRLGVDVSELAIRREGRVPALWLGDRRAPADLSLSHHGALVAFACVLAPVGGARH